MSQVNAEAVQAALSNILDGLMDRGTMPAVRLSNTKTRVVRLMNAIDIFIDHEAPDREDGSKP